MCLPTLNILENTQFGNKLKYAGYMIHIDITVLHVKT